MPALYNAKLYWVDLSYPNLNFLSFHAIHDMMVRHGDNISSLQDDSSVCQLPLFFLNFVNVGGSSMKVVDAKENSALSLLPFSADNPLYNDWCQLIQSLGTAMPFLVVVPRGPTGAV